MQGVTDDVNGLLPGTCQWRLKFSESFLPQPPRKCLLQGLMSIYQTATKAEGFSNTSGFFGQFEGVRSDFNPRRSRRTSIPSKRVPLIWASSSRAWSGVLAAEMDCSVTIFA